MIRHVEAPDIAVWDFWAEFERGEWEPETLTTVRELVPERGVLIDIGAWIGPVTLYAAVEIGAAVVAYEPDPVAVTNLRANIVLNAVDDLVVVVEAAVAPADGTVRLGARGRYGDSMSYVTREGIDVAAFDVGKLPITGADLVKVDIEGGEPAILGVLGPRCAEHDVPLLVAWHQPWWASPVDHRWFDGFAKREGPIGGWGSTLFRP